MRERQRFQRKHLRKTRVLKQEIISERLLILQIDIMFVYVVFLSGFPSQVHRPVSCARIGCRRGGDPRFRDPLARRDSGQSWCFEEEDDKMKKLKTDKRQDDH